MRSRLYALAFISLVATLFVLVLLANLLIDPEGVLGTGITRQPVAPNDRYQRFTAYQRVADRHDGLLVGSSRTLALALEELSRGMNADFTSLTILSGMMTDFAPMLRYILRDKREKQRRVRAVFLLVDLDTFGTSPETNLSLQTMLPPEVTGESAAHFGWRYLSAIQFRAWRSGALEILTTLRSVEHLNSLGHRIFAESSVALAADITSPRPPATDPDRVRVARSTTPSDFANQLDLLREIVFLCNESGVRLVVATSPLHRRNAMLYRAGELARRRDSIAAIVPLWDFGSPDWLSDRADLWGGDESHFLPPVGKMMLDAIFDPANGSAPADFGRLYGN